MKWSTSKGGAETGEGDSDPTQYYREETTSFQEPRETLSVRFIQVFGNSPLKDWKITHSEILFLNTKLVGRLAIEEGEGLVLSFFLYSDRHMM